MTAVLIGVSLAFFSLVVAMSFSLKQRPELLLDAKVSLEITVWSRENTADDSRILPCVIVQNPTRDTWRNVTISLNKQFYHYHPDEIPAGGSLTMPLELFVTKGGNVNFRPAIQKVELVTVFAQIPSGERAVFERDAIELEVK